LRLSKTVSTNKRQVKVKVEFEGTNKNQGPRIKKTVTSGGNVRKTNDVTERRNGLRNRDRLTIRRNSSIRNP